MCPAITIQIPPVERNRIKVLPISYITAGCVTTFVVLLFDKYILVDASVPTEEAQSREKLREKFHNRPQTAALAQYKRCDQTKVRIHLLNITDDCSYVFVELTRRL